MNGGFERYGYMQQGQTDPAVRRQQMAAQLAQQIMGQPAQSVPQGAGQLAAGIGMGLRGFMDRPQNQFPTAPGAAGGTAKMQSMDLGALFGFGPKGGLY